MDWAAQMLGLSPEFYNSSGKGGGCIQNTASEAAIVAIVAARNSYQQAHTDAKLEELTHSLGMKAGMILGLAVRAIDVKPEDNFALRGNALHSALQEDIQAGKKPFILIATVGTTSSGAIDNLKEIKEVGKFVRVEKAELDVSVKNYPDLRIHVDSAWLGIALVCPEFREMCYLDEINEIADSFCTNFHKWGLTKRVTNPISVVEKADCVVS
ncbi:hypothetical protein MPER_08945 [Moniliophthora perniciosa FA553]|nr:hypothetical protein MPER_08945 [Moniliophthora perniciosa FA553]